MCPPPIQIIYGGYVDGFDGVPALLDVLQDAGVKHIDTAQLYGKSEEILGQQHVASRFIIDTKDVAGFSPGTGSKEEVLARAEKSLRDLQTDSVSAHQGFGLRSTGG